MNAHLYGPQTFRQVGWKNGRGQTTELLAWPRPEAYEWRLSMAPVNEDGAFSDFAGFQRTLILLRGNGLHLTHDANDTQVLRQRFDIARFDGGARTFAQLEDGPILDFNLMVRTPAWSSTVHVIRGEDQRLLPHADHLLVYAVEGTAQWQNGSEAMTIATSHLLHVEDARSSTLHSAGALIVLVLRCGDAR